MIFVSCIPIVRGSQFLGYNWSMSQSTLQLPMMSLCCVQYSAEDVSVCAAAFKSLLKNVWWRALFTITASLHACSCLQVLLQSMPQALCVHSVCLCTHHQHTVVYKYALSQPYLSTVLSNILSCPSFIIKGLLTATVVSPLLCSQTCSNTGSRSMCDAIQATACSVEMLWCDSLILYLLFTRN